MDSLYIVIPAYNEEENIRALIDEWYPVIEKYDSENKSRLVIINDGSTDNTLKILLKESRLRPLMEVINKKNGGHGSAVIAGYRYAIGKKADYIFQTDSDRQTLPEEFDGFWRLRRKYDAVIGCRRTRQDGKDRAFVTKTLRLLLLLIFRRNIPDANAPYRLMRRDVLEEALSYLERGESLPNICISAVLAVKGRPVHYKNITFRPRQGGKNSLNMKKIAGLGLQALKRFIRLKKRL